MKSFIAHELNERTRQRSCGRSQPGGPMPTAAPSAQRFYFFRSPRLQHAASVAAFSLVIGISVVYIDALDGAGLDAG